MRPGAIALILLAALAACGREERVADEAMSTVVSSRDVAVVERATIETGPRVAGSLEAQDRAVLRAEVTGSVLQVHAEVGDTVRKGDVLGRIEERSLREAYRSAQTALASAASELHVATHQNERTQRLVAAGALPQTDLESSGAAVDAAQARVGEARARVEAAREQLDAATIRAPFAGVVSERGVSRGDVVAPGAMLYTIIDPSSMRLSASVPSEALASLRPGAAVEFRVRGYPDQVFTGSLDRIAPAADPVTRQIPIIVAIPNPEGKLVAGLFADGRVTSETREALTAPLAAVDVTSTPATVKRVNNGAVEEVAVEVGVRDEATERVELRSGAAEGDRLLTGSARSIPTGTAVELASAPRADTR